MTKIRMVLFMAAFIFSYLCFSACDLGCNRDGKVIRTSGGDYICHFHPATFTTEPVIEVTQLPATMTDTK